MGKQRSYSKEALEQAAAESSSIADVLRRLGIPLSGGMHAHISRRLKHFGIDTQHFLGAGHRRGQPAMNRLTADHILVVRPPGSNRAKPTVLRRALLEIGVHYCCAMCGLAAEWQGRPLTLHIDHINGNYEDCRRENLRFLCPNCHTQTPSWAGRNKSVKSYRIRLAGEDTDASIRRQKVARLPPRQGTPLGAFELLALFDSGPGDPPVAS